MKQKVFSPNEPCAINPKAFGALFDEPLATEPLALVSEDGVSRITIRGPLMHHADFFFDSYESILGRFEAAIAAGAQTVVLDIDSPGGVVSGAFETSRKLRSRASEAGVKLLAYTQGTCASAAYALAIAAEFIGASQAASIGSIGVVASLMDLTVRNQAEGVNIQLVSSGERKVYGDVNVAITPEIIEATQTKVDALAEMFFALCEEHGFGNGKASLQAMQGDVVYGAEAVKLGLISSISTMEQTLEQRESAALSAGEEGKDRMPEPMDDVKESLRKMTDGDNEEEAKKAKAALAALDGEEDEEKSEDSEEDKDAKAEGSDDEPKSEDSDDDKEAKATVKALRLAAKTAQEFAAFKAEAEEEKLSAERKSLLDSRPDLPKEIRAALAKAPIATVRDIVKTAPKLPLPKEAAAAAAMATSSVRGDTQGVGSSVIMDPEAAAKLDRKMGMVQTKRVAVAKGNTLQFGVRLTEAEAQLATLERSK